MSEKKKRKESIVEIVGLPTLAAGAGTLVGGIAGGAVTRKLLGTPGIRSRLAKMSRDDKVRLVHTLHSLGAGTAGTASAVGSYALSEYIRDKMDERREMERDRK
jgi:hypothetical protein